MSAFRDTAPRSLRAPENAAAHAGLIASLDRLETLLDDNLAALQTGASVDDAAVAQAKGRMLLELSRHPVPTDRTPHTAELADRVARVRRKLNEERRLLQRRLEAAELISAIITETVMADEGDGTYAPYRPAAPAERPR